MSGEGWADKKEKKRLGCKGRLLAGYENVHREIIQQTKGPYKPGSLTGK